MMTQPICKLVLVCCALGCIASTTLAASASEQAILKASGTPAEATAACLTQVDELAAEFQRLNHDEDATQRLGSLHAFLHQRVLRGSYLASASNVSVALEGGPFNCVAATVLLRMLCERCGLHATAMSTRGHVWCRVTGADGRAIDVESTCRDWFEIVEKYRGVPISRVSTAMAAHRRRVANGRPLNNQQLLAVLHFNHGVAQIEEQRLAAAALANLRAISLDPECRPAWENMAAARRNLSARSIAGMALHGRLILWAIDQAVRNSRDELAAN